MNLLLVRHAYLPDVTLGKLTVDGLELATLEEPWIANAAGPGGQRKSATTRESCAPDGTYVLKPHSGTRVKNVWRLSNPDLGVFDFPEERKSPTWGRAAILIHVGNTTADIEGCILVGMYHAPLDGKPAVRESGNAMAKLRAILPPGEHHHLEIRPSRGTAE